MIWTCFIPSEPVGRAEKRVTYTVKGKTVSKLADKDHVSAYKTFVKEFIATSRPERLMDGPLRLVLQVYRQRPKSTPRRVTRPTTKPDVANYYKLVEDCLKGLVIVDDARVVEAHLGKYFAEPGKAPGVYVEVGEMEAGLI